MQAEWGTQFGWTGSPSCSWYGIFCDSERNVIQLNVHFQFHEATNPTLTLSIQFLYFVCVCVCIYYVRISDVRERSVKTFTEIRFGWVDACFPLNCLEHNKYTHTK